MKNIACFDIGGTFIKYGIVNENGDILLKSKFATPKNDCKNTIPIVLNQKIDEMSGEFAINSIGISTAGQVDSDKGEIIFASDNIPGYTGAKLSDDMTRLTGLKCYVENDVNSAALGELWKGNIECSKTFFFMTLGTGIGGAVIIDGRLFKGSGGGAGEIGHMTINENGYKCTCGCEGCYERYASSSALIRAYCKASGADEELVSGEQIIALVRNNDPVALGVYNDFIGHIATGLASVTHLLDPGLIIIGGGISENNDLINAINERFKEKAMPSYSNHTKIISSSLKNDAGLLGACYIGLGLNSRM
jgi:glucokinase